MDSARFETSGAYPAKSDWDAGAAELVGRMLQRWHLTPAEAFVGGEAASVLRVATADGAPAVLKVGFPHVEAVWEAVGLEAWGPDLAPRVLRQDAWTWSLLLERVEPGVQLGASGRDPLDAVGIGARLYVQLAEREVPTGPPRLGEALRPFHEQAVARLETQADRIPDRAALAGGLDLLGELISIDTGNTLLHGDYNPGNILSSGKSWRVIDPKPMIGDPAFDLWPLVSQLGNPWTHQRPGDVLLPQLRLAADITGVDLGAATRWAIARSALNVSWFVDDGNRDAALAATREQAVWAELGQQYG